MKFFKIVIFFLLICSSSQFSACQNPTLLIDMIGIILPHTSINFARNLLRTCTHFNKKYHVRNNITKHMISTLSFGLDRILLENPRLCSNLSDSMHLKCLIHYATRYDRDHNEVTFKLFNSFRRHATANQKELDQQLQLLAPDKESIFVYQGKKKLELLQPPYQVPLCVLQALTTIYSTHHLLSSLSAVLLHAIDQEQMDLVDDLATNYPDLLNSNDRVLEIAYHINHNKSVFLEKAVIKNNLSLVQYLLPYCSIRIHYLRAMKTAPLNMLEILINDYMTKNILDPEIIADILCARLSYKKLFSHHKDLSNLFKNYHYLTDLFKKKSHEDYYNALEIILSIECSPQVWKWIFFDPYFDSNNSREKRLCESLYETSDERINFIRQNTYSFEKININYIYPNNGLPILHMFITEKNYLLNLLKNRLDLDPNILSEDEYKETALHCALRNNKLDKYTYWLLTHSKADLYIADKNGKTVADLLARLLNINILKEIPLHKIKKLSYLGLQCRIVQYYKSFLLSTAVLLFFMAKHLLHS